MTVSYRKITEVCFLKKITVVCFLILSLCAVRGSSHQSIFRLGFVLVALNHGMTKAEEPAVHVKHSCSEKGRKRQPREKQGAVCVCIAGARKAEYKQL